jgi:hypothetical protein
VKYIDSKIAVLKACSSVEVPKVISLVFTRYGLQPAQIFLPWEDGKRLRNYIRDPKLRGHLSLFKVTRSRVVNQDNKKLRLAYVPKPNEEIHIIGVS